MHEFHFPVYVPNPVCERFLNLDRLIFKLHHSLLSRRQFCWVLTSEQKGECCRHVFSFTSGSIDSGRILHPPFTFRIQYTKTVCESGQISMHLSMICPSMKVTSILLLFKHKISDLYLKFYGKSTLSPSFEKKYSHKTSYQNRLSINMFSLDAALLQGFDIYWKIKKNHMYRHEIVPTFCVRFAIILQMSNQIKFCSSLTNINPSWWWHVLVLHILYCRKRYVKQFTGTVESIECVLNCQSR